MHLSALFDQLTLLDDSAIEAESQSAHLSELRKVASEFAQASLLELKAQKSEYDKANVQRLRFKACDSMLSLVLPKYTDSIEALMAAFPTIIELCTRVEDEALVSDNSSNFSDLKDERESDVTSVAKALFTLSKDASNDRFFTVQYVESILSVTDFLSDRLGQNRKPKVSLKALLYAFGTLKNVANTDGKMQDILATSGAIGTFARTLLWSNAFAWENATLQLQVVHCLIQTTSLLRTLQKKRHLRQFDQAQVSQRLCDVAACCVDQIELLCNIFRILSNLTLHEPSRAQINGKAAENISMFLEMLRHCMRQQGSPDQDSNDLQLIHVTIVRIVVVLGNLSAGNDRNREIIYFDCDGRDVFFGFLETLLQQSIDSLTSESKLSSEEMIVHETMTENLDLLIRLVRLIANVAINSSVSEQITNDKRIVALIECLQAIQLAAGTSRYGEEIFCQQLDELMLNIVSCLTNLSYHSCSRRSYLEAPEGEQDWIYASRLRVTLLLGRTLENMNEEAVMEAVRAFGNLTRWEDVVAAIASNGILRHITQLLHSSNLGIVHAACGVLMNAALCPNARLQLIDASCDSSGCLEACEAVLLEKSQKLDEYADLIANVSKTLFNLLCVPFYSEEDSPHNDANTKAEFHEAVNAYLTSNSGETLTKAIQRLTQADSYMNDSTRSVVEPIVSQLNTKLNELSWKRKQGPKLS